FITFRLLSCAPNLLLRRLLSFPTRRSSDLNEGPHLQKIAGEYLLTWSNYDTRDPRYQICFAKSKHIYGPYEAPEDNRVTKPSTQDRKSTRLNSSHVSTSYAVFCLKKKKQQK